MSAAASPYLTVTEQPGQLASREQLTMMAARYAWAASYAAGCDVLEVACGSGTGLGLLAKVARHVEAGDIDDANLRAARQTYTGNPKIDIRRMNAMGLPCLDRSRDLILLFEAIYYFSDPCSFFREAHRVLRPGGRLLIATVNREWDGFNPSPLHTRIGPLRSCARRSKRTGSRSRLTWAFRPQADSSQPALESSGAPR